MRVCVSAFLAVVWFSAGCVCSITISYSSVAEQAKRTMMPIIEELCGSRFKKDVQIVAGTVKEIGEIIIEENADLLKNLSGQMTENEKKTYERTNGLEACLLLAKYSPSRQKIYIIPDNIAAKMDSERFSIDEERKAFTIIVGHELVHAMQDQTYGAFQVVRGIDTLDASDAFNACVEGHAVFIMKKAVKRLGYGNKFDDLAMQGEMDQTSMDVLAKSTIEHVNFFYSKGAEFFEYLHKKGGMQEVNKVLGSPPKSTDVILHPARWFSPVKKIKISTVKTLAGVDKKGDFGGWSRVEKNYGEAMCRSMLLGSGFNSMKLDNLLEKYLDGVGVIWSRGNKQFSVTLIAFRDAEAAREFSRLDRENLKMLSENEIISLKNSMEIRLNEADFAWKNDYSMTILTDRADFNTAGFRKEYFIVDVQCVNASEMADSRVLVLEKIMENITK